MTTSPFQVLMHAQRSKQVTPVHAVRWPLFVLISSIAVPVLAITLGVPQFFANDDIVMALIADGSLSGEPNEQLVFVSPLVGWVLSALYSMVPAIGWYAVAIVVTNVAVMIVAGLAIRRSGVLHKALWCAIAWPSLWILTVFPSFTATAIVAVVAGTVVLSLGVHVRTVMVGMTLLILGVLWRSDALVAGAIASMPVVLLGILRHPFVRTGLLGAALLAGEVIARAGKSCFIARDADACPAWADFAKYNAARGAIHGTIRGEVIYPLVGSDLGWSSSAAELFRIFAFFDNHVFYEPVLKANASIPALLYLQGGSMRSHAAAVLSVFVPYAPVLAVWLIAVAIVIWAGGGG